MSYLLDTNAISEWVKPRPDPGIMRWLDGLIAATAKVHQLRVVTRNVAHFQSTGVEVLCPWQGCQP
jgi:predicted nucleic acid-binding protein